MFASYRLNNSIHKNCYRLSSFTEFVPAESVNCIIIVAAAALGITGFWTVPLTTDGGYVITANPGQLLL
ncbi:MAG: hypothetical protein ACLFSE_08540 [Spirochaetia bacterium]